MELGKILLVGSTGYLGGHLAQALGLSVLARSETTKQSRDNFFDTVVHAAHFNNFEAESEFINSFPDDTYFIFFSSAAVYGETSLEGASVETKPAPINDYGRYKLKLEALISSRFKKYLILRISNVYDREPRLMGVYQIFKKAIKDNKALGIFADKQEVMQRDFIHIEHFITMLKDLILNKATGIFNISSGVSMTMEAFAKREFPNIDLEFEYLGSRDGEIQVSVLKPLAKS